MPAEQCGSHHTSSAYILSEENSICSNTELGKMVGNGMHVGAVGRILYFALATAMWDDGGGASLIASDIANMISALTECSPGIHAMSWLD